MTQRELLEKNLDELRNQLEKHQQMIEIVLDGGALEMQCQWNNCRHHQQLLSTLAETVQVLDETRKAFKSKSLEQLRVRLLRVMAEEVDDKSANLS